MRNDPNLQHVATYTGARTYYFKSTESLGGWALCTVHDETGELLIVSDWGNWSHIWNPKNLGKPSLTHFIAERSCYDYLANKLLGREASWVIDANATIKKWRRQLVEARLREGRRDNQGLDTYLAREIWDAIGSLRDDEGNEAIFIDHAYRIDGFTRWISQEPWEDVEHRHSHTYRVLVDFILPALASVCGETTRTKVA